MRLFSISDDAKLVQYAEHDFKEENREELLETWLENNPSCILEDEEVLILGRQVSTNLKSVIDLLGVDKEGDVVVIELKRDQTPRETLAQILEYASFIEGLSYEELQGIFRQYLGEENAVLADQHRYYFKLGEDEAVAFNKDQKLVLVGQTITRDIKQTANFLRKRAVNIFCMEFKYFRTRSGEEVIATDFVVGQDGDTGTEITSRTLPKVNREAFLKALPLAGRGFFERLLDFADSNDLPIHWGTKGFSVNVEINGNDVNILYGYPPGSSNDVQSIYTVCAEIVRKVNEGESVVESYRSELSSLGGFVPAGKELKYVFTKDWTPAQEEKFFEVLRSVDKMVKTKGLKE